MTITKQYPCGCSATGEPNIPNYCPEHDSFQSRENLRALVQEASEIMEITYAGNFPAGIESFLIRAHAVLAATPPEARAPHQEE